MACNGKNLGRLGANLKKARSCSREIRSTICLTRNRFSSKLT